MKLLGSLASPFVRKVRIVLAEKSIAHEFQLEDVMPANSAVLAWNPLGKIPCLVLSDGSAVYDSPVICDYLEWLQPTPSLLPDTMPASLTVKRYEALADGILDAAILYRWELTQREPHYRDPAWLARQALKIDHGLRELATQVDGRLHCVGKHLTRADIAVVCLLEWLQFRLPCFDWPTDHPDLARFVRRFSARPAFVSTAPRPAGAQG